MSLADPTGNPTGVATTASEPVRVRSMVSHLLTERASDTVVIDLIAPNRSDPLQTVGVKIGDLMRGVDAPVRAFATAQSLKSPSTPPILSPLLTSHPRRRLIPFQSVS